MVRMAFTRRRTVMVVLLALYWPLAFVLSHVPMPEVVRDARISDKGLHFLAYLVLTFLLFLAVKPFEKVRWRKATAWCVLGVALAYGICDELLQYYVAGRSTDVKDLVADAAGAVAALGVLTFLSFWPACVTVAGTVILTLGVFIRANVTHLLPVTATVFHFLAYAVFTLLWAGYLHQRGALGRIVTRGLLACAAAPVALLVVVKVGGVLSGKAFSGWDMVAAAGGVLLASTTVAVAAGLTRRRAQAAGSSASAL
jgi:VanZ family protein